MTNIAIIMPRKEKISGPSPGAAALTVIEIVRHSRFKNHTRILVHADQASPDGINLELIKPKYSWFRSRSKSYALACIEALTARPADYIDVHNRPSIVRLLAPYFPKSRLVLWLHNEPQTMGGLKFAYQRKKILDSVSQIICVSNFVKNRFLEGLDQNDPRVVVRSNMMDLEKIVPTTKSRQITYLGRIVKEKGVLELAQAFVDIADKIPSWNLTFIGLPKKADNPSITEYAESIYKTLEGLSDRVNFMGRLDHGHAMKILSESEISIMPSLCNEAFPRAAMEAMACGAALIAAKRGGLPEVTGDTAIWLDNVTPETLSEAIIDLVNSPYKIEQLRSDALERVKKFDSRVQAKLIDDLRS